MDSLIWKTENDRFLNADGLYTGKTGSDTFHPVYNGLPCLGVHTEYLTDIDGNRIKPGGGNQMYKAYAHIFETLEELPGKRMVMTENFGECFLKYYDMARIDSWPALDCVDTESRGMFTYATDLKVELEEKSEYLPVEFIPFIQAVAHEYLIMQDGTNAFPPGQYWHMNWVVYRDSNTPIYGIQWPYYGGNTENPDDKWLAYNADLAYSFCYGNRMIVFDVDVPTDEDGIPTTDDEFTLDLLTDGGARNSVNLLENSLNHYTALGWPETKDKPAEALFFGKLLPEPGFDNMMPSVDCQYDLTAGMMGPNVQLNVKLRSSWVLHSLWKATMPLSSGDADRLVLVFSNFTPKTYTVTTNPIDITEYLPNGSRYCYFKYAIDGELLNLNPIEDPHHFQLKSTVKACKNNVFGILKMDFPIPPPSGLYARLNNDDFQDLILLDDGPDKTLSVVLGDGTGSYDELNAIPIMNGDADIILEGQGKSDGSVLSNVGGWKFTQ